MPDDALAALAIVIVVVYLVSDPPYPGGARKSSRRYRHDDHDRDHVALRGLLQGLPCAEMVSGPRQRSTTSCSTAGAARRCR